MARSGRHGGWIARWDEPRGLDGSRKQRTKKFDRKGDAEAYEADARRRRALGPLALERLTRRHVITLDEWIVQYWTPEHAAGLEPATRERYASSYKLHIYPSLGSVALSDLSVATLRFWQSHRLAAGASPETVTKARVMLSSVLTHAAGAEEVSGISSNPLKLVKPPKMTPRDAVEPLSPTTIERIRTTIGAPMPVPVAEGKRLGGLRVGYEMPDQRSAQVRSRDALIVSVLAYTGMRPEELRALRWADVRQNTIVVQRATNPDGSFKTTKNRKRRSVRLMAPLAQDLREYRLIAGRPAAQTLIFPRKDGRAWTKEDWDNWRQRTWGRARRRAGLAAPIPYDLRHSAASLWIAEGRQPLRVAQWLGHSVKVLLETYAHLIADFADDVRIDAEAEITRARSPRPHSERATTADAAESSAYAMGAARSE
jgi:integrase